MKLGMNAYNVTGKTWVGQEVTVTVIASDTAHAISAAQSEALIHSVPAIVHVTEIKLVELAD